jgi:general secretion pathway protein K
MALLTVALVAGIAASAMGDLAIAFDGVTALHDQAQARLLARGAIDWARNVLSNDARTTSVDHLGETWAIKVPPTAVEDGEVSGEVADQSGRFNLNNLVRGGQASPADVADLINLLGLIGVAEGEASGLADALVDWLDAVDKPRLPGGAEAGWFGEQGLPQRPPNGALLDVMELTQVRGFSPDLVKRLKPLVAALPPGSRVNVNTASAEVLAAFLLPKLGLDAARQMLAQRERAWFKDIADFKARLPNAGDGVDTARLATTSQYFLVISRGRYGVSTVPMEALLERKQNWPEIVWQRSL